MKKYLFIALAALGFAACAEKDEMGKLPINNGETEQSYVAVTFTADGVTRADLEGDYEVGTTAERAVKSAYVFFFKENGEAFAVDSMNAHSGDVNYLDVLAHINKTQNKPEGDAMENVSDIKDAVLVLKNYKGEYPAQVVAVLNWTPTKSYSLDELRDVVSELGNDTNGYVMSNSVYLNNNKEIVDAVALTAENIAKDEFKALENPITIHVERIAAKVEYDASDLGYGKGIFKVGEVEKTDTTDDVKTTVFARIEGFELYNDYETSKLIKEINPVWGLTSSYLGFNWNDVDARRSFWAVSLDTKFPDNNFDWKNDNIVIGGSKYLGENTRKWSKADDVRTKVIVKATLVEQVGNEFKPLEVVNWWGKDYVGEKQLLTVVANTLVNTYFTSEEEGKFVGLAPADIKCVGRNPKDKNAYEVYFAISDDSKSKKWFKYENGTYKSIDVAVINEELASVQPARVYKEGMTYYYTDIRHLANDTEKIGAYGVVRNHVYRVNITDIQGFGTPVYDPEVDFITPEKPVDIDTFVAAQINILSWRVVDNTTTLQ